MASYGTQLQLDDQPVFVIDPSVLGNLDPMCLPTWTGVHSIPFLTKSYMLDILNGKISLHEGRKRFLNLFSPNSAELNSFSSSTDDSSESEDCSLSIFVPNTPKILMFMPKGLVMSFVNVTLYVRLANNDVVQAQLVFSVATTHSGPQQISTDTCCRANMEAVLMIMKNPSLFSSPKPTFFIDDHEAAKSAVKMVAPDHLYDLIKPPLYVFLAKCPIPRRKLRNAYIAVVDQPIVFQANDCDTYVITNVTNSAQPIVVGTVSGSNSSLPLHVTIPNLPLGSFVFQVTPTQSCPFNIVIKVVTTTQGLPSINISTGVVECPGSTSAALPLGGYQQCQNCN